MGSIYGLLCLLFVVLFVSKSSASVQCQDMDGNPVDWFIVYKMPKMRHETGTVIGEGLAMFYLDGQNPVWNLSKTAINETGHAIYYTLQQLYKSKENSLLYLMYNDEVPKGPISMSHGHTKGNPQRHNNHGHTKGVVTFDSKSGFWLIHSAPKFPTEKKNGYEWSDNASDYGQTFLCMSFGYEKSMGDLATQLLYNYPQVYDSDLPDWALSRFPLLADLVNHTRIQSPPYSSTMDLKSLSGMPLKSFAKFTYYGADLYDSLVAPTFKTPLMVETWRHDKTSDVLPTNCSVHYQVYNIQELIFPGNIFFDFFKDHSKYAISLTNETHWICVGDINREKSQFKRGGGTLCFQNLDVWKTYHQSVRFFEPCPK